MKNRKLLMFSAGLLSILLISGCGQQNVNSNTVTPPSTSGKTVVLSTDKPYQLITFEEPGCIYCEALSDELAHMSKANPLLFSSIQWTKISVSPDNPDTYVLTVNNHKIKGNSMELAYQFQLMGFPTSFILDKKGNLILRLNGYYPEETMKCVLNYVSKQLYKHESIEQAC